MLVIIVCLLAGILFCVAGGRAAVHRGMTHLGRLIWIGAAILVLYSIFSPKAHAQGEMWCRPYYSYPVSMADCQTAANANSSAMHRQTAQEYYEEHKYDRHYKVMPRLDGSIDIIEQ